MEVRVVVVQVTKLELGLKRSRSGITKVPAATAASSSGERGFIMAGSRACSVDSLVQEVLG